MVSIILTYSGCPAIEVIALDIMTALAECSFDDVRIEHLRSPAWSSDFISKAWHSKAWQQILREYDIAPPEPDQPVLCAQCGAAEVEELARLVLFCKKNRFLN